MVVGLGDALGGEGVGLDDVGTGTEITAVDVFDNGGLGDVQHVIVTLEGDDTRQGETASEVFLRQSVGLYQGA